jgi:hypothetical protein
MFLALLLACAAFGAPPGILTDLAPPGMKTVSATVVFEFTPALVGHGFVIDAGGGWPRPIEAGARYPLTRSFGTDRIFALAPGETLPVDADGRPRIDEDWIGAHARAELPFGRPGNVPLGSPLDRLVHRVRLLAVDGNEVRFEVLGTERLDAEGRPVDDSLMLVTWIALALCGAGGLVGIARRRRTEAGETAAA